MKTLLILICAVLITGCANPGMSYVEKNKPLAEQGKLLWSTYYEQAYAHYSKSGSDGSGALLSRINDLIVAAKSYERGEIPKDRFDYLRRKLEAEQSTDNETRRHAQISAMLNSMQKNSEVNIQPTYQIVPPVQLSTPQPAISPPVLKQTDFSCLSSCTAAGRMYGFCQSKCSY